MASELQRLDYSESQIVQRTGHKPITSLKCYIRGGTNDWINALQSLQCSEAVIGMIGIHWQLLAMICTIALLAK